MEFTNTKKGNRKLIHEGYMYVFQKNLENDAPSWGCEKRLARKCKAKINLDVARCFLERMQHLT